MLGIEPWFPQPPMSGQGHTVHSIVKVPQPFVPFASGVTLARRTEGGVNILESRIDHPVMFTVVLAGRYEYHEETRNGIGIPNDKFKAFWTRNHLIYDKGAYLLATIHKEVGDKTFLTFMKSYQKTFRWQCGNTKDIAGLLEYLTKKDYKPFFEQYFWGTAMPQ